MKKIPKDDCFSFDNGKITSYDWNYSDIKIPSTIWWIPVTIIGDYVFFNKQLKSVEIPDSVTSIGISAFQNNQLTSLIIPNWVTSIWINAFSFNKLTSIIIPNMVEIIWFAAFQDNQLKNIIIWDNVTSIGKNAFYNNGLSNNSNNILDWSSWKWGEWKLNKSTTPEWVKVI